MCHSLNLNWKNYLILGAIILATGFLFAPSTAKATTVYLDLENQAIYEGDTFVARLRISAPDKPINVVDGTITYDNNKLKIKEISAGGSLFALWPKPPVFSNDQGTLSFVGGIPSGFRGDQGEILKIFFIAKDEGKTKIDFLDGFSVFLHDGQGTRINPWLRPLSVNISKRPVGTLPQDAWQALVEGDKTPPEPFEITIGQHPSVFDNQMFLSFFAVDKESGIDRYEIQEGTGPYIVGDPPYLLKDQELKSIIRVKAVDRAGNERIVELVRPHPPIPSKPPQYFYQTIWFWLILILLAILAYILTRTIKTIIKGKMFKPNKATFKILLLLCLLSFGIFVSNVAQAATLYFSPSSGNFTVGNIFTINILVNTEGAAINNSEAVINFSSNLLEVISVSKSGSIFSLWVEEPTFSNVAGTISFNGGLPTPGFTGSAGKLLSAVFRVKKAGSASLVFSSAAVRANDGYGTNVFRIGTQALFNLILEERPSQPPVITIGVPASPIVSSPTHPDPEKWYSNNAPEFSWRYPADINGISFLFDQKPASDPGPRSAGLMTSKKYTDISDGIWYFHIKFRNEAGWGEIAHRKILVDTLPPVFLKVEIDNECDPTNPTPILNVEAEDLTSGLDYYELKIDGQEAITILPLELPYRMPPQKPGKYKAVIKAVDRAGNFVSASKEFVIKAPSPAFIKFGKIALDYISMIIALIILIIGAAIVIVYSWYRISLWRKRIKKETKEAEKILHAALASLQKDVRKQVAQLDGKPDLSEAEKRIYDVLNSALKSAEKIVSKEIEDIEKESQ